MSIPAKLRQEVIAAASARCEYCQTSSRITGTPLVMEHILPKSLGGSDDQDNLAASCYRCNEFKGVKTHVRDPESGQLVALFNPREQVWADEFAWSNGGTSFNGSFALTLTFRSTGIAQTFLELRRTFEGRSVVPDVAVFCSERIPRDLDGQLGCRAISSSDDVRLSRGGRRW